MKIKRQNVTLLLGNGPNRISHVGISWLQVLEQLEAFSGSRKVLKHSVEKHLCYMRNLLYAVFGRASWRVI